MQSNLTSHFKEWLLPAYYLGTWPLRRLGSSVASLAGKHPIAILFYHRVADECPSPWTISNREFARQVAWLLRNFDIISLAEVQRRMRDGHNDRPAVSITFDDGYADNCQHALPLLIARRIPFTYFVSTQFILRGEPFPQDVASGTPLAPNTVQQLRALSAAGVEIGAHTRTHADLGKVTSTATLHDEIVGSREDLQEMLQWPVRYFAFPYGQRCNLQEEAFRIAHKAGFAGVCSAYGSYNIPGDDAFHLQRLHADPHFPRLRNWLTMDPRLVLESLYGQTSAPNALHSLPS